MIDRIRYWLWLLRNPHPPIRDPRFLIPRNLTRERQIAAISERVFERRHPPRALDPWTPREPKYNSGIVPLSAFHAPKPAWDEWCVYKNGAAG